MLGALPRYPMLGRLRTHVYTHGLPNIGLPTPDILCGSLKRGSYHTHHRVGTKEPQQYTLYQRLSLSDLHDLSDLSPLSPRDPEDSLPPHSIVVYYNIAINR